MNNQETHPMHRRSFALSAALMSVCLLAGPLRADEIEIRTPDGVRLRATYRKAEGETKRAALLLHMLGGSRKDWKPLESLLLEKGISTFALDFRGHGESVTKADGSAIDHTAFDDRTWPLIAKDVAPALQFLESQGFKRQEITLIGASIGANVAVINVSREAQLRSAVLLSPGMNYRQIRIEDAVREWNSRPLLVIAAEDDAYSAGAAGKIREILASKESVKVEVYPGHSAHGTRMLDGIPGAAAKIAGWVAGN